MTQDSENDGNDARSPSKPLQYQKITQKKDINITNEYGTKKTSRHCSLFTFNILSRIILLIQYILNKYAPYRCLCKLQKLTLVFQRQSQKFETAQNIQSWLSCNKWLCRIRMHQYQIKHLKYCGKYAIHIYTINMHSHVRPHI